MDEAKRKRVVAAYVAGKTTAEVAAEHGVSRVSVINWVRKAGHAVRKDRHRYPEALRERAVRAYLEGKSLAKVADEFGVSSRMTVSKWLRAAGHAARDRSPYPAAMREQAVAAFVAGRSARSIARELGVPIPTVHTWARAAGAANKRTRRNGADL